MNKAEENYVDHEVRVRVLEVTHKEIRDGLKALDTKMDYQFRWLVGLLFGLFGALLLTKLLTW